MPLYLTRFSYTPETWARLIDHPDNVSMAAVALAIGPAVHSGRWRPPCC